MARYLFMGDPHVKPDNLVESERVIDFVVKTAKELKCMVILSGDQYNDHGIVHVPVLDFWSKTYAKMEREVGFMVSLIGNHDLTSDYKLSPMDLHASNVSEIVGRKGLVDLDVGFIGFIKKNEEFIAKAMEMYNSGVRLIFCHAEFDGAKFESGMYCPNGIPLTAFPNDLNFISGHIHDRQEIKDKLGNIRVIYPGTPRQLTRSDLGREKSIFMIDTTTGLSQHIRVPASVSEPFQHITVESLEQLEGIPNSERVYVDVKGSKEFIELALKKLPEKCKARSMPDKVVNARSSVKESEGMNISFAKYLQEYSKENKLPANFSDTVYTNYLPGWKS